MSLAELHPWTVTAVNLPEHARNPIHTDAGARAAGFPSALVAGVSTYAYMTHVPVDAWGTDWVAGGGCEVRFAAPVFDGDALTCAPVREGDDVFVDAVVDGACRVRARVWNDPADPAPRRDGDPLPLHAIELGDSWVTYGERLGDDEPLYGREELVHPAAWPALANEVMAAELVTGAWIHTRSVIRHHGLVRLGAVAVIESHVVDRFSSRLGDRAIVDMTISVDDRAAVTIEHEAIVRLHDTDAG